MDESREELMVAIDDLVRQTFGPHLRPRHRPAMLDLTVGQMEVLHTIGHLGAPSMSDLSRELGLHPSSLTGIVDKLVRAGKVRRESDSEDRRVVRVVLTEEGLAERDLDRAHRRERLRGLLGALDDDGLRALHDALTALHDALAVRDAGEVQGG